VPFLERKDGERQSSLNSSRLPRRGKLPFSERTQEKRPLVISISRSLSRPRYLARRNNKLLHGGDKRVTDREVTITFAVMQIQERRESNPYRWFWRPLCYHCTTLLLSSSARKATFLSVFLFSSLALFPPFFFFPCISELSI
jgi:hypothetical protein